MPLGYVCYGPYDTATNVVAGSCTQVSCASAEGYDYYAFKSYPDTPTCDSTTGLWIFYDGGCVGKITSTTLGLFDLFLFY